MTKPILLVVGTRPEAIKIIPIYIALKKFNIPVLLCSTSQHKKLLSDVFHLFDIKPDFDLDVMRTDQDLFYLTNIIMQKIKEIFEQVNPRLVLVHGDTTTTMAVALSAFYMKIPIGHIEAGLRSHNIYAPFPEEMNRKFISIVSQFNFAPTAYSVSNLLSSGIERDTIFCTGNTVTDALRIIREKIESGQIRISEEIKQNVDKFKKENKKIVLLTAHRRESFDGGISRILYAIKDFAQNNDDVIFFYPYHPNPNVVKTIEQINLKNLKNILLFEPILYQDMIYLLLNAHCVATDSGGIQEEAASLLKPTLVLRNETDRPESVYAGIAKIVGTDDEKIKLVLHEYLNSSKVIENQEQIYGDGFVAEKIVKIIQAKGL